jgi:hypothetical protein
MISAAVDSAALDPKLTLPEIGWGSGGAGAMILGVLRLRLNVVTRRIGGCCPYPSAE